MTTAYNSKLHDDNAVNSTGLYRLYTGSNKRIMQVEYITELRGFKTLGNSAVGFVTSLQQKHRAKRSTAL